MDKVTREELVKRAKQIFERKENEQSLIATEDGQFFLNDGSSMSSVQSHCKENGLQYWIISRAESFAGEVEQTAQANDPSGEAKEPGAEPKPEKPIAKMNKTELQAKATELNIEFLPEITNKDLIALIEAALAGPGE